MNDEIIFKSLQIGLASPEKIREWSRGEVKKPETINYRTLKPEKEGLFCEKIFGPTKDWECNCGKYKRIRHKGIVCENCGVEVTRAKVRRERMGHIELAAPVSHIWYFKGIPSRMGLILEMSPRNLEKIIYFASYVVTDPGDTPLAYKQVLSEREYREAKEEYGGRFSAGIGAEAIQELLCMVDLDQDAEVLKEELADSSGQKRIRIARRLEAIEAFRTSHNKPEWMILETIPVIPPELRPMVQLDGGRFATSDLNDLYRRVINRNNRLNKLLELDAPDIIVQNEKRMLQEAVDALIDNGRRGRAVTGPGNRPFKSLSDMLKGKQGRFRQNLLGKRVDYSGRSVIVVGPELKMYQCGLPKEMAIELFKPFVMRELVSRQLSQNIKSAKKMVEKLDPIIWDVLEDVIHEHPVLLNRAPTLHRLGIQAFEPVLVEGRAIKLHPLACTAYNADFDGDQMAVHVPLSMEAQAEARFLMMACNNILKPQDGTPVVVPSQDMILGTYYMTLYREDAKGTGSVFMDQDEMEMAYFNRTVDLHAMVKVRMTKEIDGVMETRLVESTVGRFLFNQILPQDMGFVKRETVDDMFKLEVDMQVDKKVLTQIVDKCFKVHGPTLTSETLDEIKRLGYAFSTRAAITVGVSDMQVPGGKEKILAEADKKVEANLKLFRRGLISEEERYQNVVAIWNDATDEVTDALLDHLDRLNPINMMADSGARGSKNQIRQLAGMRGLMTNTTGRVIELPIRSNFREGLDVMEFFSSTHGARKGLADTALRTADSGYLTRRLVDVSQDVIVREEDCGTPDGYEVTAIKQKNEVIEQLGERLAGRYAFEDVMHPETGEILVEKDQVISSEVADAIEKAGIERVLIRSVLNCKAKHGVCRKCYGVDMTTWKPVEIGEAVGTIAAQSIGEPGTQLTMRTFHTGGVASADDITQGLPRVEELFEARKPKGQAIISEIAGRVEINEGKKTEAVVIGEDMSSKTYLIPYGSRLRVLPGDHVEAGEPLTEGSINPHDILDIQGVEAVQHYLLSEVQKVYRLQGVHISDKHIELIVRQMLRKVKIEDAGDTGLITGAVMDIFQVIEANELAMDMGLKPAVMIRDLMGITKASLATDSFLSAASFQETTRVLTDAAIKGKVDPLMGLKENVIIGQLVPAGTGVPQYSNLALEYDREEPEDDYYEEIEEEEVVIDDLGDGESVNLDDVLIDDNTIMEKVVEEEMRSLEKDDVLSAAFDMFDMDFLSVEADGEDSEPEEDVNAVIDLDE
ncbi:MAG: DNA-directed RNA polymerase subunit beta' [Eubacterium aggregans]|uniref:DNA-directed RNA polymerase subunit beta' n=1 Tax=Eubacterium aggregans TaxID=81409 RepID=A0A1H4AKX1_9FIRM|nr:DNA-directed RNA polymerase subunit beta' [Eubacterium aggregans]MEA5073353.1 DNA-directed RNA polymerase subunit beta' [Eubacterium aggregans]SEA36603.1 DNA-directed RNA polymerase subunit beta' [Eubacterium aggregans]